MHSTPKTLTSLQDKNLRICQLYLVYKKIKLTRRFSHPSYTIRKKSTKLMTYNFRLTYLIPEKSGFEGLLAVEVVLTEKEDSKHLKTWP